MSTTNEVLVKAALGISPHKPIPPELLRRIHRVEELVERQGRDGWTLSRQVLAVVIEQWERDESVIQERSTMERYEYIQAHVGWDELRWTYRLVGGVPSSMSYDEDVSKYTEEEIRALTAAMLEVPDDQTELIEVVYE